MNQKYYFSKEELVEAYNELESIEKVANKLKCSVHTIRRYFKKYNIKAERCTYSHDHDFFSRDNEESFYWAGFLAADGCVMSGKADYVFILKLCLALKDKAHLEKYKKALSSNGLITEAYHIAKNPKWNDTESCTLAIYSRKMCDDLKRFNIVPRKTLIYTFPEWLKTHPLVNHFIRGYIDGDGCYMSRVGKKRKIPQLHIGVRGTVKFLTDLAEVIDKNCDLDNIKKRKVGLTGKIGGIHYNGNKVTKKIIDFIFKDATIYLDRKWEIIKDNFDFKIETKKCLMCNKYFETKQYNKLFCSKKCKREYNLPKVKSRYKKRMENKADNKMIKLCIICEKEFKPIQSNIITCSKDCSKTRKENIKIERKTAIKNSKVKKIITCIVCKKDFEQLYHNSIYCSKICHKVKNKERRNDRKSKIINKII